MNSMFKMLENDAVREAWNEVMEALVVEKLKEDYLLCLDWNDIETAEAILVVLRYSLLSQQKIFLLFLSVFLLHLLL